MARRRLLVLLVVLSCTPCGTLAAQERNGTGANLVTTVLADPTTYAPAILYYSSARLDWASSQPFFRAGITEHNPAYTISGRPDDVPVGYGVGNRMILTSAFVTLATSAANNLGERALERWLIRRSPAHRTMWRALGHMERIGFASFLAMQASYYHFAQWRTNEALASQRGFR